MFFFQRATVQLPFSELRVYAEREGFISTGDSSSRSNQTGFRWASGEADFDFFVEYSDRRSVTAEAYGDIFGLVLLAHSHLPTISVEIKKAYGVTMGKNAARFRKIMLGFPGFDGGTEDILKRFH